MTGTQDPGYWGDLFSILLLGTGQTLYMVGVALVATIVVGLPLGVVLVGTEPGRYLDRIAGSRRLSAVIHAVLELLVTSAARCRSSSS